MRDYEIRYDPKKAAANLRKHGVSFEEAAEAMGDKLAVTRHDEHHSKREDRYLLIGETTRGLLVTVSFTFDDDVPRIINVRRAEPAEKRRYMNQKSIIRDAPMEPDDDMLPDYGHLEGWQRNPYKFVRLVSTVTLEPDVFNVFRTSEQVNAALRQLIADGRHPLPFGN